ncbi:MAG: DUF3147 family protein [FCB group bacterium]|nr:DUF3147 family protein [FCB group bacterium]
MTFVTERLGSKVGGLIANLPSHMLISLVFLGIMNGADYVVEMTPGIPVGMMLNSIFTFAFVLLLRFGLLAATAGSLLIWLVTAVGAAYLFTDNMVVNIVVYVVVTLATYLALEHVFVIRAVSTAKKRYSLVQMILRAVFAGSVVVSVLLLSKLLNPLVLGIFSVFPAVMLVTMVILAINQNRQFAQATGKVLILSSSNIVVFGLGIAFTYPRMGIVWGTAVSFIAAGVWVWIISPIVQRGK